MSRRTLAALPAFFLLGAAIPAHAEHGDAPRWMVLRTASNTCLEASVPRVRSAECTGSANQVWSFQGDHLVTGEGLCLATSSRDTGLEGARLLVTRCAERPGQRFVREGKAIVDGNGLCVDGARGQRVETWACDEHAPGQRWSTVSPAVYADPEGDPDAPVDEAAFDDDADFAADIEAVPVVPLVPAPVVYADTAVVVQGPATIVMPPPPSPAEAIDQAFRVVNHAMYTFRNMVDLFAPGSRPLSW